MIKRLFVFFLIVLCMFQAGFIETEIIDELNIISGVGFDYVKGDTVEGTVLVPQYVSETETKNITFNSRGKISWDLISNMHRQSQEPLVTGSMEILGFGEKLAKQGIIEYMDALSRDPAVGARIHIFVSDGTASEILKQKYTQRGTGTYISDILQHNQKQRDLPMSNFHIFLNDYYEIGKDPYLPIIKLAHDKSTVEIVGVGLFKEGKMIERISTKEMFPFKLLVDKYSEGSYLLKENGDYVDIRSITSKRNINVHSPNDIFIDIEITGIIREYTGNMITPAVVKNIQTAFEKELMENCHQLIYRFQTLKVDPIGIGSAIRSHTRHFNLEKWTDQYPNLNIKVNVKVKLIEWGIWE